MTEKQKIENFKKRYTPSKNHALYKDTKGIITIPQYELMQSDLSSIHGGKEKRKSISSFSTVFSDV